MRASSLGTVSLARLAIALALCWSVAALAALTEDDAVRIGREANVQGLRALIAERNPALIYRATASWNFGTSRDLPAPLEAVIVEYYGDRTIQRSLLSLLGRQLDNHERSPKYRTRPLFDLLAADLRSGKDNLHYAIVIIATDLAVDAELTALLPQLDPASANEIVMFLGHRKHAAAVPALQALQARVPHDKNMNQMIERVDWAYLQIGTAQAMQALYARLRTLGQMKTEQAASEVWNVLVYLNQQPPGSPPDYGELRAALPAELNDSSWDQLIRLIENRKERRGVQELQRAIMQSKRADQAVSALLAVGTPEDWRAARQAVQNPNLQQRLDAAIADPAKFSEQRRQRERTDEMYRALDEIAKDGPRLDDLRRTDPARYAAEVRALLERSEAVVRDFADVAPSAGKRQELARQYVQLGAWLRFELRRPDDAIAAYEKAAHMYPDQAFNLAATSIADVYRFDKRDNAKALAQYRSALASAMAADRQRPEGELAAGLKTWLEHEIAYLERGTRFSGAVSRADMGTGQLWLMLGSLNATSDSPPDPRTLPRLPPSQLQIARTFPAVLQLEPQEMLAFFAKHDPAGYLTAAILAAAAYKDPSPYVKSAAETFFRERGLRGGPSAKPDPRYASPEKTWAAFIAAGKKGDAAAMLDCMTPDIQRRFGPLFSKMSRDDLRKSAESFLGMSVTSSYGEFREAMVVRQLGGKKMAGSVTFVNEGGSWKIAEM